MDVEEVSFDSAAAFATTAAPAPGPLTTPQRAPSDDMPTLSGATASALEAPSFQDEMTLESPPTNFPTVKVRNPFGDGEIEVEEVNFGNLPGFAPAASQAKAPPPDAAAQLAAELKEGDWFELRQEGKEATQARLSLISPYRSTFVFSNRKGQKVAEYSLYQVTSYLRAGRLARLQETPLFDRAFGNIVSLLRGGPDAPA